MKTQSLIARLLAIVLATTLFASCKKDHPYTNLKKPFKAKIDTWYRISPTDTQTVIVNDTPYIATSNFPGGGTGIVTYMGKSSFYFNQLTYAPALDAPPAGSIGVPVIDAITYPVLGLPLPFIQPGDFTPLANANSYLHIPSTVRGAVVNSVYYDDEGNAIFTSAITGSGSTFPISETLIGFNGKGKIVGGRGKFQHAIGAFNYDGYFNIIDANDAAYNADGWILY